MPSCEYRKVEAGQLSNSIKPKLLILTSSFPDHPMDETCGYLRDFARAMSETFCVTVLAPPALAQIEWPDDAFYLHRSPSIVPRKWNPFLASRDVSDLSKRSLWVRLVALFGVLVFAARAVGLARQTDAICSHWMVPAGLIGAWLSSVLKKPQVVIEHSGALHGLQSLRGGRRLAQFIADHSHQMVFVSRDLVMKFRRLCPQTTAPIDVLPMGITDQPATETTEKEVAAERIILFIGRLVEIKGVEVLLRAVARMQIPDVRVVIAGDGEQRANLEAFAAHSNRKVQFVGQVDAAEKARLLRACAVVVIPSLRLASGRTEGTPVVCLEALRAGKPIIASRVGGLGELITDGWNGVLFDAGDAQMLAEKLDALIADRAGQQRLAVNAKLSARNYGWSLIGAQFAKILLQAIRSESPMLRNRFDEVVQSAQSRPSKRPVRSAQPHS